jgi:hypothetical protein
LIECIQSMVERRRWELQSRVTTRVFESYVGLEILPLHAYLVTFTTSIVATGDLCLIRKPRGDVRVLVGPLVSFRTEAWPFSILFIANDARIF